ncbi:MAG: hypothetical protein IJ366_00475 [Clostridia bacterium]|nr:hypothetical protein [Clostridia bacterium]MBQ7792974.1 hypothetical protein [Clostridia bacterium]
MKYKEFVDWCNERACDGRWDIETAIFCGRVIDFMSSVPFWKRKIIWEKLKNKVAIVVSVTNAQIKEITERQIPRKPDYEDNDAKCPVCGHEFENNVNDWGCSFCQDCGQQLDWSDSE